MRFDVFLLGGVLYRIEKKDVARAAELIRREGFSPKGMHRKRKSAWTP